MPTMSSWNKIAKVEYLWICGSRIPVSITSLPYKFGGIMAIHITDIKKAYELLNKWCDVTSRLSNDGVVMVKEMQRLKVQTEKLISEE